MSGVNPHGFSTPIKVQQPRFGKQLDVILEEAISEGQTSEMRKRFGNLGVDSNTPSPAVTNTGLILSSLAKAALRA